MPEPLPRPDHPVAVWVLPAACGVALAVIAAALDNLFIPVGLGEVATAFALGAVLRSRPLLIGTLLVLPSVAVLIAGGPEGPVWVSLAVFVAFALFNGAMAGAGATWAAGLGRRRPGRAAPAPPPDLAG